MLSRPYLVTALLILASLSTAHALPSSPAPTWQATHNSPGRRTDAGKAIAVGEDGSVYVTGYAYRGGAELDFVTIKYNTVGRQVWSARYDGPAHRTDVPTAIGLDEDGNVFVAGRSARAGGGGDWDYVLVKYLPDGRQHWVRRQPGSPQLDAEGEHSPTHLVVNPEGSAYLSGIGGNGYVVTKFAGNGEVLWQDNYGPTESVPFPTPGLAVMARGNGGGVLLGGSLGQGPERSDLLVVGYSTTGQRTEYIAASPIETYVRASAVVAVGTGGFYAAGGRSQAPSTLPDILVARYAQDGSEVWSTTYAAGPQRAGIVTAAALDPQGNLVVTGYSWIPGQATSADLVTLKFDAAGELLESRIFDGPLELGDRPADLAIDAAGRITVVGTTGLGGNGDTEDYLLIRYSAGQSGPEGLCFNGRAGVFDGAAAVALDDVGNPAVTGITGWQGQPAQGVDYAIGTVFYKWPDPPALQDLRIGGTGVRGGKRLQGAVQLTGPVDAPTTVTLVSSNPEVVLVPASVKIKKRGSFGFFTIRTRKVTAPVEVSVTATFGGVSETVNLTVRP